MIFSVFVSIYIGGLGLFFYNYVILIPVLRGLCVLFYYISCLCYDTDDDSFYFFPIFFFFAHFFFFNKGIIGAVNPLVIDNITYLYNNDISWCLLIISYLCLCLILVVNLCSNLFLPISSCFIR